MPRGQGDSALYTHADDEDDHDGDGDEHDEDDEINDDASGTGQYTCMG